MHLEQDASITRELETRRLWIEHGNQHDETNRMPDYGNPHAQPIGYYITSNMVGGAGQLSERGRYNWLKDIQSVYPTEEVPHWVWTNYFYREMSPFLRWVTVPFLLLFGLTVFVLAGGALEALGLTTSNYFLNNREELRTQQEESQLKVRAQSLKEETLAKSADLIALRELTIQALPGILREANKPMEKMGDIKMNFLGGDTGALGRGGSIGGLLAGMSTLPMVKECLKFLREWEATSVETGESLGRPVRDALDDSGTSEQVEAPFNPGR